MFEQRKRDWLVKPTKFSCSTSVRIQFRCRSSSLLSSSSSPERTTTTTTTTTRNVRTIALVLHRHRFRGEYYSFLVLVTWNSPNALRLAARGQKDHHHRRRVRYFFGGFGVKSQSREPLRHHRSTPSSSVFARRRFAPPSPTTAAASERRYHAASCMKAKRTFVFGFPWPCLGSINEGMTKMWQKMEVLKNKAIYVCAVALRPRGVLFKTTGVLSDEMRVAESVTTC